MYKTVLHPKMKEFPDESVTVFTVCTMCRERIRLKATVHVKFKNIYQESMVGHLFQNSMAVFDTFDKPFDTFDKSFDTFDKTI